MVFAEDNAMDGTEQSQFRSPFWLWGRQHIAISFRGFEGLRRKVIHGGAFPVRGSHGSARP